MSREAAGTTRSDGERGRSAFTDGLAQLSREHKDKQIKHARSRQAEERLDNKEPSAPSVCVRVFADGGWEAAIAVIEGSQ